MSLFPGIGSGLVLVPSVVIVQQYFTRRRVSAASIASSGLGLGTLTMGPVLQLLNHILGWRGALLCLAGVHVQGIVFAALLKPLSQEETVNKRRCCISGKILCCKRLTEALNIKILKNRNALLLVACQCTSMFGISVMYRFAVPRAIRLGVPPLTSAFLMTSLGVSSTGCRFAVGAVARKWEFDHTAVFAVVTGMAGVLVAISSLAGTNVVAHVTLSAAIGVCFGKLQAVTWHFTPCVTSFILLYCVI